MKTWLLGALGSVVVATVIWLLTDLLFPNLFGSLRPKPPAVPPPPKVVLVECTANPPTIRPGATTEIIVKVTRGGQPVEGATVSLSVGGGKIGDGGHQSTGYTYSGGISRVFWTAPSPSAAGYNLPAVISFKGIRTVDGDLEGTYRTDCFVNVRN